VSGMDHTAGAIDSLGAFLARVRPGDRCACCGAILQPLDRGPRLGPSAPGRVFGAGGAAQSAPAAQAVMCPECGCEVSEEASAGTGEDLRELSSAA
jgi:hypothetical protein